MQQNSLRNDICAALELNETCYSNLIQGDRINTNGNDKDINSSKDSQQMCSQEHVDIVCGIRARLMEASIKATAFLENNIELLATIASLKRETAAFRDEHCQSTQILNGRISCLLEIVREQQESLDRKQETLALKGIWSNLLNVSPDGKIRHPIPLHHCVTENKDCQKSERDEEKRVENREGGGGEVDDYAANVLTWLSLQCAQEADSSPLPPSSQRQQQQQQKQFQHTHHQSNHISPSHSHSSLGSHIENTLGGISSVSELVQKVGGLFHALDSVTQTTEKENSTMRVKLQEMSAICTALRRERDEKEGEIERWKDAISVLQTDHDYASNQVTLLTHENKKLKTFFQVEKASSENWRTKCHEILEAVEKNSELTSLHHDSNSNSVSKSRNHHITSTPSSTSSSSLRANHHPHSQSTAQSSPSTFYSHQRYLFSPPAAPASTSQPVTSVYSNTVPYTLDSYCNLVEQADVVMQSPPTPFVADNKHFSSGSDNGSGSRGAVTVTPREIEMERDKGVTVSHPLTAAHICNTEKDHNIVSDMSSSPSLSLPLTFSPCVDHSSKTKETSTTERVSPKVKLTTTSNTAVEPMDPRLLDDSTLYKMLLEAENEIDEISPLDSSSSQAKDEENEEGDVVPRHEYDNNQKQQTYKYNNNIKERRSDESRFLASIDLQSAIAHGKELINVPDHMNMNEHSTPISNKNNNNKSNSNKNNKKDDSPVSISHAHFETTSYNTPSKPSSSSTSTSASASKQFSKSVHLKNISATKSASKGEWNQYFTRNRDRDRDGNVTSAESPYDMVLRRYKENSPPSNQSSSMSPTQDSKRNKNIHPSMISTSSDNLIPISPIPLSTGQ